MRGPRRRDRRSRRASFEVAPLRLRPAGAVTYQPRATPWEHVHHPRPSPERAKQNSVFHGSLRHRASRELCRPFRAWGSLESLFPGRCPGLACRFPYGAKSKKTQHQNWRVGLVWARPWPRWFTCCRSPGWPIELPGPPLSPPGARLRNLGRSAPAARSSASARPRGGRALDARGQSHEHFGNPKSKIQNRKSGRTFPPDPP
jgi:hypothetical protein